MDVKVLEKPDTAGWWWREGDDRPVEIYQAMGGLYEACGSRPARKGRWIECVKPKFPERPKAPRLCMAKPHGGQVARWYVHYQPSPQNRLSFVDCETSICLREDQLSDIVYFTPEYEDELLTQ